MLCGDGAFEKSLGNKGGTLMNGISGLIEETGELAFFLSAMRGHSKKEEAQKT